MAIAPTSPGKTKQRRGGRPTLEEANQLDWRIRDCALTLFLERGYEGASMGAIASAAGTTKASLYARFASKEDLFRSVFEWARHRPDWPSPEPEVPDLDDLEGALQAIARAALRRALDPSMVQLERIARTHSAQFPEIARTHEGVSWPRLQVVVDLLKRHAARGTIIADDPEILAEHFLAMVAGMPARLSSLGIVRAPDAQEHRTQVAIRLFLRSLRP